MFDNLSEKLQRTFKNLRGQGKLTEENIDDALKAIRLALLEADVHFKVVKRLIANIREKSLGAEVLTALSPTEQVVKIVKDEVDGDPRLNRVEGALLLHAADGLHDRRPAGFRQDDVRRQAGALVVAARA